LRGAQRRRYDPALKLQDAYAPRNDGGGAAIVLSVYSKHTSLVSCYLKMDCDVAIHTTQVI